MNPTNQILHSENLAALRTLPSASVELIYIDPPFNTGTTQRRSRMKTVRDDAGWRPRTIVNLDSRPVKLLILLLIVDCALGGTVNESNSFCR